MYEVVKHKKLPLDSYFYAAVIEGKFGRHFSPYDVSLKPSGITLFVGATACAKAKLWRKAIEFLEEMEEEEGIAPTEVIYRYVMLLLRNKIAELSLCSR